jgi:DNA-binding IclR family transcriptional regulator
MSATEKTLELLSLFSPTRPEAGLSELSRLARRDKATTYRHMQALEGAGLVEQNPMTKRYRLGPALLPLAQTRELTVPRKSGATAALSRLADATGETSHVSVLSGTTLYALSSCDSSMHSTRAVIDIQTFPLHATASGLCALAFGPPDLADYAAGKLQIFTTHTIKTAGELTKAIQTVRAIGFAYSNCSFEEEVQSLAAPIFDQTGHLAGSISVASVATRFSPNLEHCIQENLTQASREITRNWGGAIPEQLEACWARSLGNSYIMESTS